MEWVYSRGDVDASSVWVDWSLHHMRKWLVLVVRTYREVEQRRKDKEEHGWIEDDVRTYVGKDDVVRSSSRRVVSTSDH